MLSTTEILKNSIKESSCFNAVCHMFALRRRSRSTLRIASLMQKMQKEGFNYEKSEYEAALKVLETAKIGEAVLNKRGRIIGLKNIRYTLQSIGLVACGNSDTFKNTKKTNRYIALRESLKPSATPAAMYAETDTLPVATLHKPGSEIGLLVYLGGKPITLKLSADMRPQDITKLIQRLQASYR